MRNHPAYQAVLWKVRIIFVYARAWVHRLTLHHTEFIGITGSAAKTLTKDLTDLLLSSVHQVSGTRESQNVPIAVARTVLNAHRSDQYCIVEIGAYKPNAFDQPLRLINPTIGAVTIIGKDHYRAFKCIEAIAEEKGKLISALPKNGFAVLNIDDPHVKKMAAKCRCPIIWVGRSKDATIRLLGAHSCWPDTLMLRVEHDGHEYQIHTQLHGTHLALPILTALGISLAAGVPLDQAIPMLRRATPTEGRMEIVTSQDGVVFLRDDKKAPAWSLEHPLEFLRQADSSRKVAIIGTISDFNTKDGPAYRRFAREIREYADLVVFVGPNAHRALRARTGEDDDSLQGFSSTREAADYLRDELKVGDLVLVKGSNRADHLVRLIMDRDRAVQCWRHDCRLDIFCTACDKAYQATRVERGSPSDPTSHSDKQMIAPSHALQFESAPVDPPLVIIGLGNPDSRYDDTPHNIGHKALDVIAASQVGAWNETEYGWVYQAQLDGFPVHLFKPAANMNVTGPKILKYLETVGGDAASCLIIHDDMDLPMGKVRFKRDGGDAGHRGVRSVISALGTDRFARIRIGIRRSGDAAKARQRVLEKFTLDEVANLTDTLATAVALVGKHVREAAER
ncbi:aminoacyl-tRNA hydrolase [Thioalkalivibrio denitrificans]|uniref:Aminoacyl-tRNA hydrolase n=1 Tax=Thioalkalivibrio denitrificans TaxID=108003 RepID=A0A1V3NIM9_9GAMM|nr:aminoacyl-tRNA hydrolase [Thioalkalivibrio denitrificans]